MAFLPSVVLVPSFSDLPAGFLQPAIGGIQ
jgi:hypothetical protein